MKTERRHDLETNTLAKEINVWSEKVRPYTSMLLIGLAAILGLYAVLSMWNARAASQEEQAWYEYERALLEGDIDFQAVRRAAVSDDLAGTRMQEWAYVAWADRQLRRAADEYLINRESSKDRTSAVATVYEQVSESAADPEVANRARLGLARVRELQNRMDDARKEYAAVEGALQPIADARLKELEADQKEVADVAGWLATAELPTPAAPRGPGLPGVRPDFGAAPPSAEGAGGDPFNPSQTLNEILGGAGAADEGRYGDGATGADAASESAAPASDAGSTEGAAIEGGDAAAAPEGADTAPPAAEATPAADATEPVAAEPTDAEKAAAGTAPASP